MTVDELVFILTLEGHTIAPNTLIDYKTYCPAKNYSKSYHINKYIKFLWNELTAIGDAMADYSHGSPIYLHSMSDAYYALLQAIHNFVDIYEVNNSDNETLKSS